MCIHCTMSRRDFLRVAGVVSAGALLTACGARGEPQEVHWEYEGEAGPAYWGNIGPDFALCSSGTSQSPIDIANAATTGDLSALQFNYTSTPLNLINNGHTIQVNHIPGSTMTFEGHTYKLVQFHFHNPSEHALNGERFPMELHLVHSDNDGNLAVVGVWLAEGAENPYLARAWDYLPPELSEQKLPTTLNAANLLPANQSYYTYEGSLTTPPCSQQVRWLMMQEPVEMSRAQINTYGAILGGTARPLQDLNGREIKLYSAAASG